MTRQRLHAAVAVAAGMLSLATVPSLRPADRAALHEGLPRAEPSAVDRRVAVTFDDLPGAPAAAVSNDPATLSRQTSRLLAHVTTHAVPVTAFVNEGKLFLKDETAADIAAREALLTQWIDAGADLGNHTYSHDSLNRVPLADFQADVARGETVTRRLMQAANRPYRYFRHPFLQVGLELEKRRAFERWLAERGYTVAPVSIDNDEYMFAAIYAAALRRGQADDARRIADAYVAYMNSVFAFVERVEQQVLGRPLSHVLLLHANALNADHFGRIATTLTTRGYRFVSLEEALRDEAWRRPDTYVGAWGISWLHHWELTDGGRRTPSPNPPSWIVERYHAGVAGGR